MRGSDLQRNPEPVTGGDYLFPELKGTTLESHPIISTAPGIASRSVVVVAPPGYDDRVNAERTYPAVYMQDGNNCLDSDPFGHGGWQIVLGLDRRIGRGGQAYCRQESFFRNAVLSDFGGAKSGAN